MGRCSDAFVFLFFFLTRYSPGEIVLPRFYPTLLKPLAAIFLSGWWMSIRKMAFEKRVVHPRIEQYIHADPQVAYGHIHYPGFIRDSHGFIFNKIRFLESLACRIKLSL